MALTEVEEEAIRRFKWETENTDSEVSKTVYRILLDYKVRKEQEERDQELAKQKQEERREQAKFHKKVKRMYVDENMTMEQTATQLGIPLSTLSLYIHKSGLNDLKPSNKKCTSTGSIGTGVVMAQKIY